MSDPQIEGEDEDAPDEATKAADTSGLPIDAAGEDEPVEGDDDDPLERATSRENHEDAP